MGRKRLPTTDELLERIVAGEEKTISEWSEELFGECTINTKGRVTRALASLRKSGHMLFAVEIGGYVKDVAKDEDAFNHVFNRYVQTSVEPQLVRSFEYAERLVQEHPKLRDAVVGRAKQLLQVASQQNKALLGIKYESKNS